eukprot:evm.model.scf_119EXC.10 EVM.evm.TU.scf_119EXC.10   scf_119EXC:74819-75322(-)
MDLVDRCLIICHMTHSFVNKLVKLWAWIIAALSVPQSQICPKHWSAMTTTWTSLKGMQMFFRHQEQMAECCSRCLLHSERYAAPQSSAHKVSSPLASVVHNSSCAPPWPLSVVVCSVLCAVYFLPYKASPPYWLGFARCSYYEYTCRTTVFLQEPTRTIVFLVKTAC